MGTSAGELYQPAPRAASSLALLITTAAPLPRFTVLPTLRPSISGNESLNRRRRCMRCSSNPRVGRWLAFNRQTADTSSDVDALSLRGEPHPRAVVKTPAFEGGAEFSPDGRWLVYA